MYSADVYKRQSLNNLEDYNTLAGANWRVTAEVTGGQVELSQDKPTVQVTGDANQQQLIAQAVPHGTTESVSYTHLQGC